MYEQGINGINFVDSIISGTCSKNKYYESIVSINLQRDNNKPIQKKRLGVGGGSLDKRRCTALLYLDIKQHYTAGRRSQKQIQAHSEDNNIKIVVFEKHMMC